jgi:hypothetical protein
LSKSISKVPIRIVTSGREECRGELVRFYAPLTVETLLRKMPLDGRTHPCRGGHCFIIGIKRGEEKSTKDVRAGTIAYWPQSDAICLFYEDTSVFSSVNRVGRITENNENIQKLKSGTRIRIELI